MTAAIPHQLAEAVGDAADTSPICQGCHALDALDAEIEARVAVRLERDAWIWRFRLVSIETLMLAGLVTAAGLSLGQPVATVLRAALIVGASCFASGLLLLSLSAGTVRLFKRLGTWWRR